MTSRLHIGTLLGLAIAAWVVLLRIRGTPVTWDHFWPFGLVLSFVVLMVGAFEKWWWSWAPLQGWFVHRPDIRGTWQVQLKSEWVNPDTGEQPELIMCYMVVRQTLTKLNMRLMTPESSSRLEAHKMVLADDGVYHVAAVYTNEPKLDLRGERSVDLHGKRSEIHFGSMILNIQGDPPTSLEGNYWTDRNSSGTMLLTNRVSELYARFPEAHQAFEATTT